MANQVHSHSVFQFPDKSNLLGREINLQIKRENSMLWTLTKEKRVKRLTHFLLNSTCSVWKTQAIERYLIRVYINNQLYGSFLSITVFTLFLEVTENGAETDLELRVKLYIMSSLRSLNSEVFQKISYVNEDSKFISPTLKLSMLI